MGFIGFNVLDGVLVGLGSISLGEPRHQTGNAELEYFVDYYFDWGIGSPKNQAEG